MTSSASYSFSAPNFISHLHAILGSLTFVVLFVFCFFGAFMLIKAVVHVLVKAISRIRKHPKASKAGPPPANGTPAPRPKGFPECSEPYIYADYEQVIHSLIAFGDSTVSKSASWAVRDVLDVFEDDPAFFAHRLEAAIETYFAGKASADGKHRFAGIVLVEDSEYTSAGADLSAGDEVRSEDQVAGGSTDADISAACDGRRDAHWKSGIAIFFALFGHVLGHSAR
ncbi:hypothetical protein HBI44_147010 [Parastagonospora nodorum]|nr:hypothetical protein HBI44_147010 [Parastagonospora nodorum]